MIRILALAAGLVATPVFAQPPAKIPRPDEATLAAAAAKSRDLAGKLATLTAKAPVDPDLPDVAVYAKAAEWVTRHNEYLTADAGKQLLAVLDAGLARAAALAEGKKPWQAVAGKSVALAYRSRVDGSVQPYAVSLPAGYFDSYKAWRLDVVLHGRDATLTEMKFLAQRERAKPAAAPADRVVLEVYGRGNNAYRWAGETDVFEAVEDFRGRRRAARKSVSGPGVTVLRGFSMGGAGSWHIGLHHPFAFAAVQPGAGFTVTRGYIRDFPETLPDAPERTLHIYDATDYAENAFNVPVVAYSGGNDPQKAAADNVEARIAAISDAPKPKMIHVVAPGLEHKLPPEWAAKVDAELAPFLARGRSFPEAVRFATYTARYPDAGWARIEGLDRHYDRAAVVGTWTAAALAATTTNVRVLKLIETERELPAAVTIDGQALKGLKTAVHDGRRQLLLAKSDGKWAAVDPVERDFALKTKPEKVPGLQGPIDDAFASPFVVVRPTGPPMHPAADTHAAASAARFDREWDQFLRGKLPTLRPAEVTESVLLRSHLILFGDPGSNPLIAKVLTKLPITWTKTTLRVNGVTYDPKTHVPALIFPNPLNPSKYVVINSGHTFHAADFRGTNALLYPRLGDWAVLKPAPTPTDPAAAEVAATGLYDEFWR